MPVDLMGENSYPQTTQMLFDSTALTMTEVIGEYGLKINDVIKLANELEELVGSQSGQIQQFMGQETIDRTAYQAALDTWKQSISNPALVDLLPANGWGVPQNYKFQCFIDAGSVVHLKGRLAPSATIEAGTIIAQLPVGYRPAQEVMVDVAANVHAMFSIGTDGNIRVVTMSAGNPLVYFDGVTFTILS